MAVCERASIDEAYLDVTEEASSRMAASADGAVQMPANFEGFHVCGLEEGAAGAAAWWARPADEWTPEERLLAHGAVVVSELRAAVMTQLGYSCSAGIAHYKVLAKLASGMHKPAQQTVVTAAQVDGLLAPLPVGKLRQLGGKFGDELKRNFSLETVGELAAVPLSQLAALYGDEKAAWLSRLARGIDAEEVSARVLPKQLGCGKTFRGDHALREMPTVAHWLGQLAAELEERLDADRAANGRTPRLLTVSVSALVSDAAAPARAGVAPGPGSQAFSRSCALRRTAAAAMAEDATALVKKWSADHQGWRITALGLSAGNFASAPTGASRITRFLTQQRQPTQQQLQQLPESVFAACGAPLAEGQLPSSVSDDGTHTYEPLGPQHQQGLDARLPGGVDGDRIATEAAAASDRKRQRQPSPPPRTSPSKLRKQGVVGSPHASSIVTFLKGPAASKHVAAGSAPEHSGSAKEACRVAPSSSAGINAEQAATELAPQGHDGEDLPSRAPTDHVALRQHANDTASAPLASSSTPVSQQHTACSGGSGGSQQVQLSQEPLSLQEWLGPAGADAVAAQTRTSQQSQPRYPHDNDPVDTDDVTLSVPQPTSLLHPVTTHTATAYPHAAVSNQHRLMPHAPAGNQPSPPRQGQGDAGATEPANGQDGVHSTLNNVKRTAAASPAAAPHYPAAAPRMQRSRSLVEVAFADIDPEVFAELPLDVQLELRRAAPPPAKAKPQQPRGRPAAAAGRKSGSEQGQKGIATFFART